MINFSMDKLFFRTISILMLFVFSFQTLVSAEVSLETNNLAPKSQFAQDRDKLITPVPLSPSRVLLNKIKPWVVVFFLALATQAFGQNSIKSVDPLFQAVKGTVSEERASIEKTFADQMYTLIRDIKRDSIYLNPDNKQFIGQSGFEASVNQNSAPADEEVINSLKIYNYLIYDTLYKPITLKDGTRSSFYHEVKKGSAKYGVDPYLLFMHVILERQDRTSIEHYTDKLSIKASKGHFQLQGLSLRNHLVKIYDLPREERIAKYPFTRKYETLRIFDEQVDLDEVLDFTNTTSYDPLEIELAASFLKVQMSIVDHYFPGLYSKDFVRGALSDNPTLQEKNFLTAWALFYTSGIGRYAKFNSVEDILSYSRNNNSDSYAWSKNSWRLYDYIRSIDKINGYEGFNEQNFVYSDGSLIFENTTKNPFLLIRYLLKTVQTTYLALGYFAMIGFLFAAYRVMKKSITSRDSANDQRFRKDRGKMRSQNNYRLREEFMLQKEVSRRSKKVSGKTPWITKVPVSKKGYDRNLDIGSGLASGDFLKRSA